MLGFSIQKYLTENDNFILIQCLLDVMYTFNQNVMQKRNVFFFFTVWCLILVCQFSIRYYLARKGAPEPSYAFGVISV